MGPCPLPQRSSLCNQQKSPIAAQCLRANAQPAGMWVPTSLRAGCMLVKCIRRCFPMSTFTCAHPCVRGVCINTASLVRSAPFHLPVLPSDPCTAAHPRGHPWPRGHSSLRSSGRLTVASPAVYLCQRAQPWLRIRFGGCAQWPLQAVNTASVAARLSGLWLKVRPMNHKKVSEGALTPSLRLVSVWFQAGPRRQ